jgi:hypothetical protein
MGLPDELKQAATVYEDLTWLRDRWHPTLEPEQLRREISPVLRRLLIQEDYRKAWQSLGLPKVPWVSAPDLNAMLGTLDRDLIVLAFAPPSATVMRVMSRMYQPNFQLPIQLETGTVFTGFHNGLGLVVVRDDDEGPTPPITEQLGFRFIRGLPLTEWLESAAALIINECMTRKDIIHYVANKLGGAHYDRRREREDKRLAVLDKRLPTFTHIDGPEVTLPYIELLSIAEVLGESSDAARYCREFEKAKSRADFEKRTA